MDIFFRAELACFVRRSRCFALLAGVCFVLGCQPVPPFAESVRVVNLRELCKLSLEELLRVTVIEDARRHMPVLSLIAMIELPLEELLMIDVVGHSNSVSVGDASASPRVTTID